MTILIEIEKKQLSKLDELELRKEICFLALKIYEQGYFEPKNFVIWKDATLEELGGKLLSKKDLDLSQIHLLKKYIEKEIEQIDRHIINDTIIRINGNWKFDDIEIGGFFSINNAKIWRKVYGDVDIDIYPNDKNDDLMTFLWNDKKTLVDKFFNDFLLEYSNFYSKDLNLHWLAFASGIPSREDFSSLKAVYYDSLWPFITNMFLTFSEQNKWVPKSFKRKYLTQQMFKENEFKRSIDDMIKQSKISKYDTHSIILIGDNLESFSNLYEQISKEYLDPMFKELPQDRDINNIIKRIALRQKRIDSY